jgi:hypothetical protein
MRPMSDVIKSVHQFSRRKPPSYKGASNQFEACTEEEVGSWRKVEA